MGFYKTFLNLSYKKNKKEVRGVIKTPEYVYILKQSLENLVYREQLLIKDSEDYYIAKDSLRKTEYICFKNLLMLDIDKNDSYMLTDKFIKNYFNSFQDKCFIIHKSRNGYHVFVVSEEFDYNSKKSVEFMLENFCDFYYCCFSHIRGYSVRISCKPGEVAPIYTNLGLYGNISLVDKKLLDLVKLIECFKV